VRVDQADGDNKPARPSDTPGARERSGAPTGREAGGGPAGASAWVSGTVGYRAEVEAVNRRHAIDQAYERIREIEARTVTPAMRRIEAEDPDRHLAGLENRLKGKDRLTEKVLKIVDERGHTVHEAIGMVKDAIRYTFCYPEDRYTEGLYADCQRLDQWGFERVDRVSSWPAKEYKGINTRWRVPGSGQLFEVQFHTAASLEAKEVTHPAYEKLRIGTPSPAEQRELEDFQKRITARVPIPLSVTEILDYR
jgi:hypothetical protein